jgi:hypothetical protein
MRSRIFLVSLFLVFSCAMARANELGDPIIKTGGGQTTAPVHLAIIMPAPTPIIIPTFTITSPSGNSPATSPCVLTQGSITKKSPSCFFIDFITNDDGVGEDISQLVFDAPTVPFNPATDKCGFLAGSPFASCGVDPLTGGGTEFSFFNGLIPFNSEFTLDFEGFQMNTSFASTATVAPELGSFILLFLVGIAVAFVAIRARAKA